MQNTEALTEAQREYLECIGVAVQDEQRAPSGDAWRKAHEPTDWDLWWEKIHAAAE